MNDKTENDQAGIGHNLLPSLPKQIASIENFAAQVAEYLEDEYGPLRATVAEIKAEAQGLIAGGRIDDDDRMGDFAKLVKRLRDLKARIETTREAEKEPYFRGSQAADNFFVPMREECQRSDRKQRPGLADVLQGMIDDYNQRKLAAEAERRRLEAEEAERVAREKRAAEEKTAREKLEAEEAAARARKAETKEEKREVATEKAIEHAEVAAAATVAEDRAKDAFISTLAKPADMVRTRVDQGPTVTMARENYAEVVDVTKLDPVKLWPFITVAEKEKALRAWAKNTGYTQQMDGAAIGSRPKTRVR